MFDRSFDGASFDAHEGPMWCCCAVSLSSNCQTVAYTRRVVGSCWLCGSHRTCAAAVALRGCGRKLSCIGMRGCGRKLKGVDENSWQFVFVSERTIKSHHHQTVAPERASNELMLSAVRAVLLQCSRSSCPSQNASKQRGCLPQRPDPCRHSLPLRSLPAQHHESG